MSDFLDNIVERKRKSLVRWKREFDGAELAANVMQSDRDFRSAIAAASPAFIFECKKASPSKGLIRKDFDLDAIAAVYQRFATCISALTEEEYFQGHPSHLRFVRDRVSQPVLCKDFFVDEYQVFLARHFGADAILLMLSVLNDREYQTLAHRAADLGMATLTEVANEMELDRALAMGAPIIGINNRDLKNLTIDMNRTRHLAPKCQGRALVISESGYETHADIVEFQSLVDGFLVGSSLMRRPDLEQAVRELIIGGKQPDSHPKTIECQDGLGDTGDPHNRI